MNDNKMVNDYQTAFHKISKMESRAIRFMENHPHDIPTLRRVQRMVGALAMAATNLNQTLIKELHEREVEQEEA